MTVLPMSRRWLERAEQAVVVALMQPDGRLVEHIENAREARADLRGEADALRFTARQRAGRARRASRYSRPTSLRNASRSRISFRMRCRDFRLLLGEGLRHLLEPDVGSLDGEIADLADVLAADLAPPAPAA